MNKHIDELLARIDALQSELEEEYRKTREEWAQKKDQAERQGACQQERPHIGRGDNLSEIQVRAG